MIDFAAKNPVIPITVARADGRGDEPGFELARKGPLVLVEYLYSRFTGWVRAERIMPSRAPGVPGGPR